MLPTRNSDVYHGSRLYTARDSNCAKIPRRVGLLLVAVTALFFLNVDNTLVHRNLQAPGTLEFVLRELVARTNASDVAQGKFQPIGGETTAANESEDSNGMRLGRRNALMWPVPSPSDSPDDQAQPGSMSSSGTTGPVGAEKKEKEGRSADDKVKEKKKGTNIGLSWTIPAPPTPSPEGTENTGRSIDSGGEEKTNDSQTGISLRWTIPSPSPPPTEKPEEGSQINLGWSIPGNGKSLPSSQDDGADAADVEDGSSADQSETVVTVGEGTNVDAGKSPVEKPPIAESAGDGASTLETDEPEETTIAGGGSSEEPNTTGESVVAVSNGESTLESQGTSDPIGENVATTVGSASETSIFVGITERAGTGIAWEETVLHSTMMVEFAVHSAAISAEEVAVLAYEYVETFNNLTAMPHYCDDLKRKITGALFSPSDYDEGVASPKTLYKVQINGTCHQCQPQTPLYGTRGENSALQTEVSSDVQTRCEESSPTFDDHFVAFNARIKKLHGDGMLPNVDSASRMKELQTAQKIGIQQAGGPPAAAVSPTPLRGDVFFQSTTMIDFDADHGDITEGEVAVLQSTYAQTFNIMTASLSFCDALGRRVSSVSFEMLGARRLDGLDSHEPAATSSSFRADINGTCRQCQHDANLYGRLTDQWLNSAGGPVVLDGNLDACGPSGAPRAPTSDEHQSKYDLTVRKVKSIGVLQNVRGVLGIHENTNEDSVGSVIDISSQSATAGSSKGRTIGSAVEVGRNGGAVRFDTMVMADFQSFSSLSEPEVIILGDVFAQTFNGLMASSAFCDVLERRVLSSTLSLVSTRRVAVWERNLAQSTAIYRVDVNATCLGCSRDTKLYAALDNSPLRTETYGAPATAEGTENGCDPSSENRSPTSIEHLEAYNSKIIEIRGQVGLLQDLERAVALVEATGGDRGEEVVVVESEVNNYGQSVIPVYTYIGAPDPASQMYNVRTRQWKDAWSRRGYSPVVLTFDDAKRHRHFERYEEEMEKVPVDAMNNATRVCYYRYLAMSEVGGGMLVDLDTVPTETSRQLDTPEKLTFYCDTGAHGRKQDWVDTVYQTHGNSCVAAATAEEWAWIAMMVRDIGKEQSSEEGWTDRHSLYQLKARDDINFVQKDIAVSWHKVSWDVCNLRFFQKR